MKQVYSIVVLTDLSGWLLPYVEELAAGWNADGHSCRVLGSLDDQVSADFCFCLGYLQLVSDVQRARFLHSLVVHESNLPEGRGWSPMTWQILEGRSEIVVSLIEAQSQVDSGCIYLQEKIFLNGGELNPEWKKLQAMATLSLCRKWIQEYPGVVSDAVPQIGIPSFYPRRHASDSYLDVHKTIAEQFDLLRVVDNLRYPACFEYRGRKYVLRVEPHADTE